MKETEKCIGCENHFPLEKINYDSGEPMCQLCENKFYAEITDSGIQKLEEYLSERGLINDFKIFCQAKFSNLTEEEICDLNEDDNTPYKRWHLSTFYTTS